MFRINKLTTFNDKNKFFNILRITNNEIYSENIEGKKIIWKWIIQGYIHCYGDYVKVNKLPLSHNHWKYSTIFYTVYIYRLYVKHTVI